VSVGENVTDLPASPVAARVLAHSLIEQTQVAPCDDLVDRLAEQARTLGWGETRVLLLHCRLIRCGISAVGYAETRQASDLMLAAAQDTGDEILIALAWASRALFLVEADRVAAAGEDISGMLAQAVAMLDDAAGADPAALGLRALELPAAFVECGQAYHRHGLWELENEMYVRATDALRLPLPAEVRSVGDFTRRVLVINRLESAAALASALLETGQREAARQAAAAVVRPSPEERDALPPAWIVEILALERLLDVIAGHDVEGGETAVPAELFRALRAGTWPGYQACLLLAAAIGAHDGGDVAAAARAAARAARLLDDYKPSLTTLALHLAAQTSRSDAALRYSQHLTVLRWESRMQVLEAARSRLAAARVLREGKQLSRQAFVDALTGLANRHAETRHLAQLRRRGPLDQLAVVLIDADHFKSVNDTFGHAVGDEVLRVIGTILQASIRSSDLAVRLGGDEFMLLMDLPAGITSKLPTGGIVRAVALHHWDDVADGLRVTVSAGQALGAACDVDTLIQAADANLYRAKAAGRGRAVAAGSDPRT